MRASRFGLAVGFLFAATVSAFAQQKGGLPPAVREKVVVETDVEYGKAGERSLKLDVLRPKADSEKPRPAVVWIHGGGWQGGNKASGLGRLGGLAASGDFVCFTVGYRLTDETAWPGQIHDCKAAIRWIRANAKKYGVDAEKIGVWGSSAGGHLVSMLGTSGDVKELEGTNGSPESSSRVTCVVDFCGPSDFLAFAESAPNESRSGGPVQKLLGGPLSEKKEVAKQASPVTFVSPDDPPFLIVHGTDDRTVPLNQAERLHEKLKTAGVNVTFVKIVGGGHGIGGPAVDQRVRAFLDRHLLGKEVAVSAEPIALEAPGQK